MRLDEGDDARDVQQPAVAAVSATGAQRVRLRLGCRQLKIPDVDPPDAPVLEELTLDSRIDARIREVVFLVSWADPSTRGRLRDEDRALAVLPHLRAPQEPAPHFVRVETGPQIINSGNFPDCSPFDFMRPDRWYKYAVGGAKIVVVCRRRNPRGPRAHGRDAHVLGFRGRSQERRQQVQRRRRYSAAVEETRPVVQGVAREVRQGLGGDGGRSPIGHGLRGGCRAKAGGAADSEIPEQDVHESVVQQSSPRAS